MTWWMVDDALYDSQNMEQVSSEALGVHILMCSYVGKHIYDENFDPSFTLKRVELVTRIAKKPPTPRKLQAITAELVEAGMWCDLGGRYRIVESQPFGKFAGSRELSAKRAAAGRAGGRASGASRRSNREANASSKTEANASDLLEQNRSKTKQPVPSLTDTDNPPDPPQATYDLAEAERRVDTLTGQIVRDAYPGRLGRRADTDHALAVALEDCDPRTLYGAVIRYARAVDNGDVLRKDVPPLPEWLQEGHWRRWQPDKPRTYEWGGVTRQWLKEHIEDHVPNGAFTASREQAFWAEVKTGHEPKEVARSIVDEINIRARRTTSPAVS